MCENKIYGKQNAKRCNGSLKPAAPETADRRKRPAGHSARQPDHPEAAPGSSDVTSGSSLF